MSRHLGTTVTTGTREVVTGNHKQDQCCSDRDDCDDRNAAGVAQKNTLGGLLEWMEAEAAREPGPVQPLRPEDLFPADIYELEAMRQHYAARAGPDLPPCTMKAGLLRGFYAHRHLTKRD
jgi:hypothetical protein